MIYLLKPNSKILLAIFLSLVQKYSISAAPTYTSKKKLKGKSHQYLTNVQCCNRRNHSQTQSNVVYTVANIQKIIIDLTIESITHKWFYT